MGRRRIAALGALATACVVAAAALVLLRDPADDRELVLTDPDTTSTGADALDGDGTAGATSSTARSAAVGGAAAAPVDAEPPGRAERYRSKAIPDPTTSTRPPTTTTTAPPFESSIEGISAAELGSSWRAGCPVGHEQLRALELSHWGYDGAVHTGRLIVHADHATRLVTVFRDIYAARFPIQRMVPVDAYGGDDQASMRANNTSAFNCRNVAGTSSWSEHAYGLAVDVNPLVNPYVRGSTVDPPEGAPYADRSRNDQGMIHDGDAVVTAFAAQGWHWGGSWSSGKDYQHFSASGR